MARKRIRRVLLVLLLLAALALWHSNCTISVEDYTFASASLPQGWDGARIVHLSDIHGKEFGRDNVRLLRSVEEAEPDLIVITGDIADSQSGLDFAPALLRGLAEIAPTYYVTGNHEWAAGCINQLRPILQDAGVVWLYNEFVPLTRGGDTIVLAGADDPNGTTEWAEVEAMTASLRAQYGDTFWLLLAHRNNLFSQYYCRLGADLTFSGHGHGGIWRLPFTDGLISPLREWFPSWTDGFYTCTEGDCDNAAVFVSRGLGNSPRVPRLFNRPEVAVVTLHTAP